MSKYLEKFSHFRQAIKQNGGIVGSYLSLFRTEEIKYGNLAGEDKFGNKYYENKTYFMGRSRWVVYSDTVGLDYDGSQIPAEWHRWMHYTCDQPPTIEPPTPRKFLIDHKQNFTGTEKQYVPYTTVPPKIQAWNPSQPQK